MAGSRSVIASHCSPAWAPRARMRRGQVGHLEGLGQDADGAERAQAIDLRVARGRREEHDRQAPCPRQRVQRGQGRRAVHARHRHVEEHQIGPLAPDLGDGLLGPGGRGDVESPDAPQRERRDAPDVRIVVHHEDLPRTHVSRVHEGRDEACVTLDGRLRGPCRVLVGLQQEPGGCRRRHRRPLLQPHVQPGLCRLAHAPRPGPSPGSQARPMPSSTLPNPRPSAGLGPRHGRPREGLRAALRLRHQALRRHPRLRGHRHLAARGRQATRRGEDGGDLPRSRHAARRVPRRPRRGSARRWTTRASATRSRGGRTAARPTAPRGRSTASDLRKWSGPRPGRGDPRARASSSASRLTAGGPTR